MNKTKNNKAKDGQAPATASAASAPSERYERREDGFYLVKTSKNGLVTETLLSNFTAEINVEYHREHEDPNGKKHTWLDSFEVWVRFRGQHLKAVIIDASEFRESLIDGVLKTHPLLKVYPGKKEHVETAIITLSADIMTGYKRTSSKKQSAPQPIVKSGADNKPINSRKV